MAVCDVPTGHPVATMVNAAAGASKEDDIQKMLKCATHLGTKNCDVLMEPYVFKRRVDGTFAKPVTLGVLGLGTGGTSPRVSAAVRPRAIFGRGGFLVLLACAVGPGQRVNGAGCICTSHAV